jgi:hypothetical protein
MKKFDKSEIMSRGGRSLSLTTLNRNSVILTERMALRCLRSRKSRSHTH